MTAGLNNSTRESDNPHFVWHVRGSSDDVTMEFVNWPSSLAKRRSPGSEFVVLRRVNETEMGDDNNELEFEWGVSSLETRLPLGNRTVYPFICESKANSKYNARVIRAVRCVDIKYTFSDVKVVRKHVGCEAPQFFTHTQVLVVFSVCDWWPNFNRSCYYVAFSYLLQK
jgi:hypothetical protein